MTAQRYKATEVVVSCEDVKLQQSELTPLTLWSNLVTQMHIGTNCVSLIYQCEVGDNLSLRYSPLDIKLGFTLHSVYNGQ